MATEKRLIDANEVIKETESILNFRKQHYMPTVEYEALLGYLKSRPTVDAVEVPCRCKECKYWRHYDHLGCTEFVRVCTFAYYMIDENGYCLYGAKMDGGNENG